MKVETTALSISQIGQMYSVNGKYFADLYRNKISGFHEWFSEDYLGFYINHSNIGPYLSIDETCLSNGQVWTFITNKQAKCSKGSLVAAIPGTKSDNIIDVLNAALDKKDRRKVKEVTTDLSASMMLIARAVFTNAYLVNDRFHVQQIYNEAIDDIRIDIRRELMNIDNQQYNQARKGRTLYQPQTYSNGETMRQVLARSKHTLMTAKNKWTEAQRHRINILFRNYPILKQAYDLSMEMRYIFNQKITNTQAGILFSKWYAKIELLANENFRSVIKTFKNHSVTILNYFHRRATNASAEAFNSKVKIFRSQLRGVRDQDFFIFRLSKLFG